MLTVQGSVSVHVKSGSAACQEMWLEKVPNWVSFLHPQHCLERIYPAGCFNKRLPRRTFLPQSPILLVGRNAIGLVSPCALHRQPTTFRSTAPCCMADVIMAFACPATFKNIVLRAASLLFLFDPTKQNRLADGRPSLAAATYVIPKQLSVA